MKNIFKSIIIITLIFLANYSYSADISLYTNKVDVKTGDEFLIDVLVHSNQSLNAVEGKLLFPNKNLEIIEIRDGNSVINFWIQKPTNDNGIINFSGVTPAGFKGNNKKVFSVLFKAKNTGDIMPTLSDVKLLLADGQGTNSVEKIINVSLHIEKGADNLNIESFMDDEMPEYFNPIITSDPNIFEGKNFIVFATQDKGSGISHFEIKEGLIDFYKKAESPYLLKDQKLSKKIKIKAVDLNGNERIVVMNAKNSIPWYKQYEIFGLILIAFIIFYMVRRKKYEINN